LLVDKVRALLLGGTHVHATAAPQADAELARRCEGRLLVEGSSGHVSVAAPDQPRLFSRVVGLLALLGHDVRTARAGSIDGVAISEFAVVPRSGEEPDWGRFSAELEEVLGGSVDLDAGLRRRAERHRWLRRPRAARVASPRVVVDNEASPWATVLEIR